MVNDQENENEIADSIMMKDGWIQQTIMYKLRSNTCPLQKKTDEKLDAENQIKNSQRVYNQEKTY